MRSSTGAKGELLAHVSALDGLRFFAFLAVYAHHAAQNNARVRHFTEYGALGVQVFFVLSGFLIGLILLQLRGRGEAPLGQRLKVFYIRRALRIFPLYYLSLAIFALITAAGFQLLGTLAHLPWNLAYLSNLKMVLDGAAMGGLSHFWSLSVEEHFYMLAPLVVLTLSSSRLPLCCALVWVGCAAARAILGERYAGLAILSPLQFDCLAVGIATAVLQAEGSFLGLSLERARTLTLVCALLSLPLLAARHAASASIRLGAAVFEQWVFAVAVAGLVLHLWNSKHSPLTRLCSFGPFVYLGKISYGLYVWHFPVLLLLAVGLRDVIPRGSSLLGLVASALVAMVSWHAFERPINDLKRHFPYRAASAGKPATIS
jgi:peptidoglycan/LPS O-acetylase OafA/YrhL